MDKTIIKFRHCMRDIFRFSEEASLCEPFHAQRRGTADTRRDLCPICHQPVTFNLLNAPVAVPCPFSNGHRVPCAFIVASANGPLFLGEWHETELHVGISNTGGLIYNYTQSGIRREEDGWEECVCVQLVPPWRKDLRELWDKELQQFSSRSAWESERFSEEREFGSCCYGFALSFINHMRSLTDKGSLSRDDFTREHVLPKMKKASTYIKVYQEISQNGFYVADK